MSEDNAVDETGPTCLYKGGESQVFEGAEVAKAAKSGWRDTPGDAPQAALGVEIEQGMLDEAGPESDG